MINLCIYVYIYIEYINGTGTLIETNECDEHWWLRFTLDNAGVVESSLLKK